MLPTNSVGLVETKTYSPQEPFHLECGRTLKNVCVAYETYGTLNAERNNAILVTGDDYAVMAGHPSAITYAEQILDIEQLRLQTTFGTGVRGLFVYGAKLTRPDSIATVVASIT